MGLSPCCSNFGINTTHRIIILWLYFVFTCFTIMPRRRKHTLTWFSTLSLKIILLLSVVELCRTSLITIHRLFIVMIAILLRRIYWLRQNLSNILLRRVFSFFLLILYFFEKFHELILFSFWFKHTRDNLLLFKITINYRFAWWSLFVKFIKRLSIVLTHNAWFVVVRQDLDLWNFLTFLLKIV